MNVLIVGSGGREHALAWKLKRSPKIDRLFVAPGNAGTSQIAENIYISKTEEIIEWVKDNPIDLVVIGPDEHLSEGLADELQALNIRVFGPTKAAAEIEWSKAFAKQFMKEEGIPTASYEIFSDLGKAMSHIQTRSFPLVIKASGLALGKGVIIAESVEEAETALEEIMKDKVFGAAGNEVVIEEYLQGKEISVHAFCDGEGAVLFPPAQDHKRIFEGDKGLNTGGMGTIVPALGVTKEHMEEIEKKIIIPTILGLKRRGRPFKGVLFPGIMLTAEGPKVIEFNARFGDPETQSYMRILESDLIDILLACASGDLDSQNIRWSSGSACCVVCASEGYPGKYKKGEVIEGLDPAQKDTVIFHAGTKLEGSQIVTNGGRVFGVTAVGKDLKESLSKAYEAVNKVSFKGMQYRKDIGRKSLE